MSNCGIKSENHPYFGDDGLLDAAKVTEDRENVIGRLQEWASSHPPA